MGREQDRQPSDETFQRVNVIAITRVNMRYYFVNFAYTMGVNVTSGWTIISVTPHSAFNSTRSWNMNHSIRLLIAKTAFAVAGVFAVAAPSFAEIVLVAPSAPPAEIIEAAPPPRVGYVWDKGHWRWEHGRYVWAAGHWQAERVGYHWVHGHWSTSGPNWHWIEGHWAS